MTLRGAYTAFRALAELPTLVRKQRRLETRIASIGTAIEDEKAIRKAIDALLQSIKLKSGDAVTCLGYDVIHRERAGQASLNQDTFTEQLVAAGVDRELVVQLLLDCTERGETVKFAEVTPSKGAKVKAA